jgi:glycosyltransferase involved in cell wall biosynthesis
LRLLAVGRAVDKKGFDGLLSALAALPPALHWRLTHIGAGPGLSELQRQAQSLGLSDRIDWQGARTQDHVLRSMRAADLFLMTSRITADGDRDGLPNVLMEAQSQALPVIATQVSAIPELVQHGRTGVLVPPEDADAICAAIQGLASDPGRRTRLGAAGATRLHKDFGSDAGLDRLVSRLRDNAAVPRPANAWAA